MNAPTVYNFEYISDKECLSLRATPKSKSLHSPSVFFTIKQKKARGHPSGSNRWTKSTKRYNKEKKKKIKYSQRTFVQAS